MELDRDDHAHTFGTDAGVQSRFECDVCGRLRTGHGEICRYCHLAICAVCMHAQAGRGHMDAEHRHEMRYDQGGYVSE